MVDIDAPILNIIEKSFHGAELERKCAGRL